MADTTNYERYYLSYSGTGLPLKLVGELQGEEIHNRNTFFGACFDEQGRETLIHKVVYGEIEMSHCYVYHDNGMLSSAQITNIDDEEQQIYFDENGKRL